MKDTAPEVDVALTALFATRWPEERLRMVFEMFDDAKALMAVDIRARRPDISPRELRVEMFKRLYWDDLDEQTMAWFVARIE
jgi:DUF1365 family protein